LLETGGTAPIRMLDLRVWYYSTLHGYYNW